MMARIDRFFILELQEQGYDLDYKKLTEFIENQEKEKIIRKIKLIMIE